MPFRHDAAVSFIGGIDPRRSLVAAIIWLVIALAASFAIAASLWVGRVAREIVVQQHVRRLALETEQLGSDLGQAIDARLRVLRAEGGSEASATMFERMAATSPELEWIALADARGVIVASDGSLGRGTSVTDQPWFKRGLDGPWIGITGHRRPVNASPLLGDLSAPLRDGNGRVVAVACAHLTWHWASQDLRRLSAVLDSSGTALTLVLDATGRVTVGPVEALGRPWYGAVVDRSAPIEPAVGDADSGTPRFETLPDGEVVLVARAAVQAAGLASAAWQVQLSEPKDQVYQRANALATRILWISACLAVATALGGALGARRLTNRLRRLTLSAGAVGRNEAARIEVPQGRDEVAQLAAAFAKLLDDLGQERRELLSLSTELERRVAVRTREVLRLAEESRYAAIVRERLKIARDLHDTLAHSMMAMLSEVRLLRRLQNRDPAALPEELARAEQVAHDGLNEARVAIAQMRLNAVRDTGLGPALAKALDRFRDRTGLVCEFRADPAAAGFGDERAETLFRMAEEALRNVERHAMATRVDITLRSVEDHTHLSLCITDDGVGFDARVPRPGHYGLVGLREQAQLIGAQLAVDSILTRGTTVTVYLRTLPEVL